MFYRIILLFSMFIFGYAGAQDWSWQRNDELLNQSGIKTHGMNTPFAGDFDTDGDIDLIVGMKGGVVQYYENIGTPDSAIWQMNENYFATLDLDTYSAAQPSLVDLDGDGESELYVTFSNNDVGEPSDSMRKFINAGTSQDPIWVESDFDIGYDLSYKFCHQFVDYEGDGDLDLVMASFPELYFFENVGDVFNPQFELNDSLFDSAELSGWAYSIRLADVFGDDKRELILSLLYYDIDICGVEYFVNEGTNQNPSWSMSEGLFEANYYVQISLSDFDNDSDLDIMMGNYHVPIYYNENIGTPDSIQMAYGFNGWQAGPLFVAWADNICFVDYDDDDDFDFTFWYYIRSFWFDFYTWASATNVGSVAVPAYDFGLGFVAGWNWYLPADINLSAGDLNGDGFPELATSHPNQRYFINDNGNGYNLNNSGIFDIDTPGYYKRPELADFNNDGLTDLLIKKNDELIWKCYQNTGTPQEPEWTDRAEWIAGIDSNIAAYRAANINRDDRIDLIGVDGNWHLRGYINTGFGEDVSFTYDPQIFEGWQDYPVVYFDCLDIDADGDDDILSDSSGVINLIENTTPTSIDDEYAHLPHSFYLGPNYPNPFNDKTIITFSISYSARIDLAIYDIGGRLVRSLFNGNLRAGRYSFTWDGKDNLGKPLSSGVYFYRLTTDNQSVTRKMVYLK